MTRYRPAGVLGLCLLAACVVTLLRPTPARADPPAGPPAPGVTSPFAGCLLIRSGPGGFGVECGRVVANVYVGSTASSPATRRRKFVESVDATAGLHVTRRTTTTLRLDGADRTVTVIDLSRAGDGPGQGMVAAFHTGHSGDMNLSCIGPAEEAKQRCRGLMTWMAGSPTTPPTLPGVPRHAGPWPTEADLARFPHCEAHRKSPVRVQLTCRAAEAVILEYLDATATPTAIKEGRRRLDVLANGTMRDLRQAKTPATLSTVPCEVGGAATTCKRIEVSEVPKHTTLVLGAGRILDAYAVIACTHAGASPGFAAPCRPFVHLGTAPAARVLPPALRDCEVLATGAEGYGLRCQRATAVVATGPRGEGPSHLFGRLVTVADRVVPGSMKVLGDGGQQRIAGKVHPVVLLGSFRPGDESPFWIGGGSAWHGGSQRPQAFVCGAETQEAVKRCDALGAWMVAHPAPPATPKAPPAHP